MHLSAIPRRRPVPPFANHTPRAFEFHKPGKLHESSEMFGPTGMAVPAMLSAPSSANNKSHASDRSSTIGSISDASSRADVKSQDTSRPASSDIAVDQDGRNPFVDRMMTQTNLLVLPPSNPSYQMAYFLKTTGPAKEPPVKGAKSKSISSAMRIFKPSSRRPPESLTAAHKRLNEVISDENNEAEFEAPNADDFSQTTNSPLIAPEPRLPEVVVPKVSKTGQKYFEIEPVDVQREKSDAALNSSSNRVESRVSVLVTDQLSTDSLHDWLLGFEATNDSKPQAQPGVGARRVWTSKRMSQTLPSEETIRILDGKTVAPVRPLFLGTKPRAEIPEGDRHVRVICSKTAPLRSHPVTAGPVPSIPPPPLPENKGSSEVFDPVKSTLLGDPSPRPLLGHPMVLQRTSSDVTGLRFPHVSQDGIRSASDSPGPPPPRSPLRLSMPSESLDQVLGKSTASTSAGSPVREKAPINEDQAIRVTKEAAVTYVSREKRDDDLPFFLRPGSSGTSSDVFCTNATQSKTGASKPLELIDAMVKASQQNTSRRRLRRAKPEGPRPLDLSDSRSSGSPERRTDVYCTSPLSIKPTASTSDFSENYRIIATTASPSPRISHVRKVPNARGRMSPVPRAKATKRGRGAKNAASTPSRAGSPSKKSRQSTTPDLPSPPPKKELPPTPRERSRPSRPEFPDKTVEAGIARVNSTKELPSPPVDENGRSIVFPSPPSRAKTTRFRLQTGESSSVSIEARMDALERRNKLLEAALSAVLKTGGMLNGCPCQAHSHVHGHECQEAAASGPLAAHGSVRSRVSSVSNGSSALDVYLNTRGK